MHTKVSCVIIDDEQDSREIIERFVKSYFEEIEIIASVESIEDGISIINTKKPAIVFLDIQFSNGTGFDILQKVATDDFQLVFITAYNKFALQALKFSACDYLLKPLDVDEFKTAVRIAVQRIENKNRNSIQFLLENIVKQNNFSKMVLPTTQGLLFVEVIDIVYCEAIDNYTTFHFANKEKVLVSKTLRDYEEILEPFRFFRIHNSYIVNLNYIKEYIKGRGGYVILTTGDTLAVSQNRKNNFLGSISI